MLLYEFGHRVVGRVYLEIVGEVCRHALYLHGRYIDAERCDGSAVDIDVDGVRTSVQRGLPSGDYKIGNWLTSGIRDRDEVLDLVNRGRSVQLRVLESVCVYRVSLGCGYGVRKDITSPPPFGIPSRVRRKGKAKQQCHHHDTAQD